MSDKENEIKIESRDNKLDFQSFTGSLYMSALVSLGIIADPITNQKRKNLQYAQETIEILKMLKEKTKGNLTELESNFLSDCIYKLMLAYVESAKEEEKKVE